MAVGAYDNALRERLGIIEGIGTDATRFARSAAARKAAAQQASLNSIPSYSPSPTGGGSGLDSFIQAISGQESGGNYGAVNRSSGALGRYQIMPANVGNWSRAALGQSISPQQFLRSPELQDRIARYQLSNYYNKYGPAGAAVAWYAGEGNAQKYVRNPNGWNRSQGAYPSISQYVQAILRRMGM